MNNLHATGDGLLRACVQATTWLQAGCKYGVLGTHDISSGMQKFNSDGATKVTSSMLFCFGLERW